CDLHIRNILVDKDLNIIKLCDFEKVVPESASVLPIHTHPYYVPPEQDPYANTAKYTKAWDIYNLGILFWEMVTKKKWEAQKNWISSIPTDLPKEFTKLIEACLNPDPKNRPNIKKVRLELNKIDAALQHTDAPDFKKEAADQEKRPQLPQPSV